MLRIWWRVSRDDTARDERRDQGLSHDRGSDRVGPRMKSSTEACVAALLLLALAAPAESQIAADALVAVGTPVRLTPVSGPRQVASFESQSDAALVVRAKCDGGCERISATAWRDLRRVDARVRTPGSMRRAVIGGVIGGVGTYLVLLSVAGVSPCSERSCNDIATAGAAPFLIGAGTVLGATVGWNSSRHRWETVWMSPTAP
jgi:hypothetical protein